MNYINVAAIPDGTSHRYGAIYNNRFLLEEYLDGDINDRNESKCFNQMIKSLPHFFYVYPQMIIFGSIYIEKYMRVWQSSGAQDLSICSSFKFWMDLQLLASQKEHLVILFPL